MPAPAERMRMMREQRLRRGLRELRLVVPNSRLQSVRRRMAGEVARLVRSYEDDALSWIEAVSEFELAAKQPMKRGDVVVVAATGDYGKPRPAVIVQTDAFPETHISAVVCQMTSEIVEAPDFRVTIDPSERNGLRTRSQIMADKPVTVRRAPDRAVDRPPRRRRHRTPQRCPGFRYGSRGLTSPSQTTPT